MKNNWQEVKIKDVAEIISGGTPDTTIDEFWGGDINWITPTEITKIKGKFIVGDTGRKITEKGLKNSSATLIPKNSLILCSRATVGDCAINIGPITTNQGFKNLIPNEKILIQFLYYKILLSKNYLKRISSGSTFLEFSKKDIGKLKIDLPPIEEQGRIVRVLECWDEYLEKLDKKIEIKKNIKKGLMQQLLTGKKRLTGFSGEWQKLMLGEACKLYQPKTISSDEITRSGKYLVFGANGVIGFYDKYNHEESEILITCRGATCGNINFSQPKSWVTGNAMVCRPSVNNDKFFFLYLLNFINLKIVISGLAQPQITRKDLYPLKIIVPKLKEQKVIAEILMKADEEIEALEKKKEIIESQKKFLLNNLVTGKILTPEKM